MVWRKHKRYKWGKYWRMKGHTPAPLVENCPAVLDVVALARDDFQPGAHVMLQPVTDTALGVVDLVQRVDNILLVRVDGEPLGIVLQQTFPRLGGSRWWGTCPRCGRRVGKLYKPAGASFACRKCHGLTYRTCQQHKCGPGVASSVGEREIWQRVNQRLQQAGCNPVAIPSHLRHMTGL